MDIPNEGDISDVAIQKYGAFFGVLRNELRKQGIEIVVIDETTDVSGCIVERLEMTPDGIFICENEKREGVTKLQDILAYISPEDIIRRVISAMTDHQHKSLIDRLELDLKYVKDLIENKCNTPEESDEIPCDRSERKRKRKTKDEQHYHNCRIDGLENFKSDKMKYNKIDLNRTNNTSYGRQVSSFLLPTYNDTLMTVTGYLLSSLTYLKEDIHTDFE